MASTTITHNFNNDNNTDISLISSDDRVNVSSKNKNYEGSSGIKAGEPGATHYEITISSFTANSANDISVSIVDNRPAADSPGGIPGGTSGVGKVYLAKVELISGSAPAKFSVWFVNNNDDQYPNTATFCKSFSVTWSASVDGRTVNNTKGPTSCPTPTPW